ncbi:hypothetical protein BJP25_25955 [Actinokineospora bangkokensis]|uniref:DUF3558 domain-containing protein n=1 Tax=Actinokineospora bangkokensis TaxID=1193682 RepID=A0A1Q9LHV2_9PSEU|nr:hypothetical protein BJP25_25955 [Actinokineospora bangkokensis]
MSLVFATTACATAQPRGAAAPPTPTAPATAADTWQDQAAPAEPQAQVGTPASPCPMPFTFDTPAGWTPTPGDAESRDGLSATCTVTGPPTTLRAWVGSDPGSTPRGALERFIQGEGKITDPEYRESPVGRSTGVELTFAHPDTPGARSRAFAVATPLRTLVVSLNAPTPEAYQQALPAYLLAKQSLTPTER